MRQSPTALTGKYLSGELGRSRCRPAPQARRTLKADDQKRGNNLKNVTAEIPLGLFTCVTGVSGGGKSTLLIDTLYKALARARLNNGRTRASRARTTASRASSISTRSSTSISRRSAARRARTPRPIPAPSRRSATGSPGCRKPSARLWPGRFSFNVKGGRCEACQGDGVIKIEMHFLPDVYVTCEECKGKRYNRETLEVKFKSKSIADVLDMTVEEAADLLQGGAARPRQAGNAASASASAISMSASRRPRFRAAKRSA
jgi:excinuclease ABC subunit A